MQFGTSAFNTVVWWHELGEVETQWTLHNFSLFAIFLPKTIKVGENLTKFWQKQFFWDMMYNYICCTQILDFHWLAVAAGSAFSTTVGASSAKESTWWDCKASQPWRGGTGILFHALTTLVDIGQRCSDWLTDKPWSIQPFCSLMLLCS